MEAEPSASVPIFTSPTLNSNTFSSLLALGQSAWDFFKRLDGRIHLLLGTIAIGSIFFISKSKKKPRQYHGSDLLESDVVTFSTVHLPYPPETVWEVLTDFESYEYWWPEQFQIEVVNSNSHHPLIGTEILFVESRMRSWKARVVSIVENYESGKFHLNIQLFDGVWKGETEWIVVSDRKQTESGNDESTNETKLIYHCELQLDSRLLRFLYTPKSLKRDMELTTKIAFMRLHNYLAMRSHKSQHFH
eukprot:TRINITY_DN5217_c0_g1_i1.p1 TRINITY_DN5217_c0_g1~~TRINITY_DN5217_c0_g1_i1.p1  ORF type:complete len:247 (-),score=19.92 TRINITY_DN5217_c0_g1_i1:47-787(-)